MTQINGIDVIPLGNIFYNEHARDGTWCCSPYQGHPHGCPNFKKGCTKKRPAFNSLRVEAYDWYAIVQEFDLKTHSEAMKRKLPDWSERQCRNPLYWQGSVRKTLREKCGKVGGDILLDIPEASGVEVFETMKVVGVILSRHPDIVKKVMLVGRLKS